MSDEPPHMAELDRYLFALPSKAQGRLVCELERAQLQGASEPAHALILDRLRTALREGYSFARRTGTPLRVFCEPLEPFLVDAVDRKHRGQIMRSSLNGVWRWLGRQTTLGDFGECQRRATDALLKGDVEEAQRIASGLRRRALPLIQSAFEAAEAGTQESLRLAGQLGGARAFDDLPDIASLLRLEEELSTLGDRLPASIDHPSPANLRDLIERSGFADEDLVYAFQLIRSRLANPAALLQILVAAAGTDDGGKLRTHRFAGCVEVVFSDLDHAIGQIGRYIGRPSEFDALVAAIRRFHCLASGMAVSIDLDEAEDWRGQLAERRRRASEILGNEVSRVPGAIRRVLKPRRFDGEVGAPRPADITDAEHAARLMMALRPYRSEVAVNEILAGVARQVEGFIEAVNPGLLQDLRNAEGVERDAVRATFAAALSINEIVFGEDYTALLRRSGRLADPEALPEKAREERRQPAA